MGLLSWVVFGLVTGAIARFFVPGSGVYGLVVTAVLGVVGALVGGFIGAQLGIGGIDGFDLRSIAIAVGGSIILLLGYRAVGRRNPSGRLTANRFPSNCPWWTRPLYVKTTVGWYRQSVYSGWSRSCGSSCNPRSRAVEVIVGCSPVVVYDHRTAE